MLTALRMERSCLPPPRLIQQIGVTLLEIMLVLAIAAMVIVMSVRYYQSATTASQANAFLSQLTAIQAAADSLAQAKNSYKDITDSNLKSIIGEKGLVTPWGYTMQLSSTNETYIVINMKIPKTICPLVLPQLIASKRWGWTSSTLLRTNYNYCSPGYDSTMFLVINPDQLT